MVISGVYIENDGAIKETTIFDSVLTSRKNIFVHEQYFISDSFFQMLFLYLKLLQVIPSHFAKSQDVF